MSSQSELDNIQPIPASHENGQVELVEAIIGLNNMGDDWDAQHIGELIADWHNKQVEELLDRLESMAAYDPSGRSPVINPREVEAERNKLKEANNDHS